jgi:hypothetical protein
MGWELYRWVWELRSPVYIGMPPAGMLNRSRPYIPVRVLWGALTAELARVLKETGFPDYPEVGETLRKLFRFTYLYPATRRDGAWQAWLPSFRQGSGLVWCLGTESKRNSSYVRNRALRRSLLDTSPGAAIDPQTDTAAEGTLRELECIMTRWRSDSPQIDGQVAMVGYVLVREWPFDGVSLEEIRELHVGGDTRYGLGRLRLIEFDKACKIFGRRVLMDDESAPMIESCVVLAHADVPERDGVPALNGAREAMLGWDCRKGLLDLDYKAPLWAPGSNSEKKCNWLIDECGVWTIRANS